MFYNLFDPYYWILIVPSLLLAIWAQMMVSSNFKKYSAVYNQRGYTGADAARMILDSNGLYHVRIERVSGNLTDHYDPKDEVIRLSDSVYGSTSVAAVGVAAHEAGHAVQHATGYIPIKIRSAISHYTDRVAAVHSANFNGLFVSVPAAGICGYFVLRNGCAVSAGYTSCGI